MPISRDDADEILRSLREWIRNSPFAPIDEQIIEAALDGDPERVLVRYVDSLTQAIAARAGYGLTGSLHDLNEYVRTEDGNRIGSIEIAFDDESTRAFGTRRLVLQSDEALRELTETLVGIREAIDRELPPRQDRRR